MGVHFLTRPYILDKLLNEGRELVSADESQMVQLFEIGSLDVVVAELVVAVVLKIFLITIGFGKKVKPFIGD